VRHPSFVCSEFVALLREHRVATVIADHAAHPLIADATAPFVYVRLQRASQTEATGYSQAALKQWLERCRAWANGKQPADLPALAKPERKAPRSRDVFVYMINGYKPKAPAAAMALLGLLSG